MSEVYEDPATDPTQAEADASRGKVLQEIVDRLTAEHAGETPQRVRELLEAEMTAAGLDLGAEKWLGDSAVEIAAGRILVVDRTQDRRDEVERRS